MLVRTLAVVMVALFTFVLPADARLWTDSTGKYRVEAEFVDFRDGKVRIKKTDGNVVTVPFDRLSEQDQQHVRNLATKTPSPSPKTPSAKTPKEAVSLLLAAAQQGDADAFFAMVPEPYGPIQRQLYSVAEKEQADATKLAKALAERFGAEGHNLGESLFNDQHRSWRLLAGMTVVKSEPEGEDRVKLTIESVRRQPGGDERKSMEQHIAVKQADGWKLIHAGATRIRPEMWQALLAERTASLGRLGKLATAVAAGKYNNLQQVEEAIIGPPPEQDSP